MRPYGASLFFVCAKKSKQKKAHPDIRVWRLRRQTPLPPAPLRGPAYKGRPCPFTPLAASMRLVPLRNTSTRPPDGDSDPEVPGGFSLRCAHCALIVPTRSVGTICY
ncbi:hypothetical protein PA6_044_00140 [Aquipseudomonas alcaligenes NBRC 14159]|uniref:Uncharacterized protein n=1 Tax=Aquipseudomonas alcaligenes (strain ATCC 14909 / DSM 50342 / CCUG 1425 / JCM 20561 / NBRC 14159 / NCIMB 9945 / NCTC 10367 / 1577) TaxID=1215092 RepID=U3BD08_AQUA1|nr:hypothetical protein PA6_044_00140 [Pseudomonas alcaligenes NBRC 14159]